VAGVDVADQYMSYYETGRKSMKWWRHIFWRLQDMAIKSANVVYKANTAHNLHCSWQRKLCADAFATQKGSGCKPSDSSDCLKGKHFLYRGGVRKRCVVCQYKKTSARGKGYTDTKVATFCKKCTVNLCLGKCNEFYHTRSDYKRVSS